MNLDINILKRISEQYGNSFYLIDTEQFKKNFLELQEAFRSIYPNTHIAYSYKTNYTPVLCKIVNDLGGFAEVVSDMEYEVAKRIGVNLNKIIFNGPYKNSLAVTEVLLSGGIVNIDSLYELPLIERIAKDNPNKNIQVGVRCNFDIGENEISRFGIDVNSEEFETALHWITSIKNMELSMIHCHFATRKLESWFFRVKGMLEIVDRHLKVIPRFINLGGGLFGKMDEQLKKQFNTYIPSYQDYAKTVAESFAVRFQEVTAPKLILEPGSALVGDAMKFVTKVVSIKNIRGKNIATLQGSVYNINPTLHGKNPPIKIYHTNEHPKIMCRDLDFGGYTCIESDYLYRGYNGYIAVGDYVVFGNVGSYSIVLKPPFILPNFPIIDFNEETVELKIIKEAETFEDLFHTFIF